MANDNNVSSIFLLVLIGLAIYFLLNSCEGFSNKNNNNEPFINLNDSNLNSGNLSTEQIQQVSVPQVSIPQVSIQQAPLPLINNNVALSNVPDTLIPPQQNNVAVNNSSVINNVPVISDQLISEIINENSKPQQTLFEPKLTQSDIIPQYSAQMQQPQMQQPQMQQPQMQQPLIQQPLIQQSQMQPSQMQQSQMQPPLIMNNNIIFDANDDSFDNQGTDLNTAFMNALPQGAQPDMVNFKKDNNKNYDAKDFLPKQVNDEWFETDFSLAKYQLNDDKLINTEKYIIGINTVGESLKNASYDIRGTIPNPKFIVSPWNNSTYEPDFNLKPLC